MRTSSSTPAVVLCHSPARSRRLTVVSAVALVAMLIASLPASGTTASATVSVLANSSPVHAPTTARAAEETPGFPWAWPLDGTRVVVNPFRAPTHDYGPGHRGIDVAAQDGATVRAPASGIVAFRGVVVDRPLITIDHGGGYVSTFEPVATELPVGTPVKRGDAIGIVTTGGHAPRGTVHVGVRIDDVYANPHPLFGAIPRAVLLPCCEP